MILSKDLKLNESTDFDKFFAHSENNLDEIMN